MVDKTYSVIIGIGVAVLVFALLSGLNVLMTPVFAGSAAQTAAAVIPGTATLCNTSNGMYAETVAGMGTGVACTYTNATTAYSETNESSGIIYPLLPYIGIAGGLILIIFGKPISSLISKRGGF